MGFKNISDIAGDFGLTVESSNGDPVFRVYKGVKQVFTGNEGAVRDFLIDYEKDRPALFEGSMIGYKE